MKKHVPLACQGLQNGARMLWTWSRSISNKISQHPISSTTICFTCTICGRTTLESMTVLLTRDTCLCEMRPKLNVGQKRLLPAYISSSTSWTQERGMFKLFPLQILDSEKLPRGCWRQFLASDFQEFCSAEMTNFTLRKHLFKNCKLI